MPDQAHGITDGAGAGPSAESVEIESPVLVLRLLKQKGVKPFSDSLGLARIVLAEDDPAGLPLRSPLFYSRLAAWFYEMTERVLRESEIDRTINVLEGQAGKNHLAVADPATVWEAIEAEPVCHAVAIFMASRANRAFEGTMTTLLGQLNQVVSRGVLKGWPIRLPLNPTSLSAKLNKESALLKAAGIGVDWSRTKVERTVRLFILDSPSGDAAVCHPSPEPSPQDGRQNGGGAVGDSDDAEFSDTDLIRRIESIGRSQ